MKIGIITIFDCVENSGAFLQAYALKLFLEERGHEVYHIVEKENFYKKFFRENRKGYVFQRKNLMFLRVILKYIRIIKKTIGYRSDYKKKYNICKNDFSLMKTITVKKANKMNLDYIVCGSDEIWNINNPAVGTPFYFAKGIKGKKVTYAVSAGNCTVEDFQRVKYPILGLSQFDEVLVRDENTKNIVADVSNKVPQKVCDPTILYGIDKLQPHKNNRKDKYMVVYSYYLSQREKEFVVRYAKEYQLKIISLVMEHDFVDENIFVSPLSFGEYIKNAECVYTTTLHGSIFTILNHKRAVFCSHMPKVKEVICSFGLSEQLLREDADYDCFKYMMNQNGNQDIIDENRRKMAEQSAEIFLEVIGD